MCLGANRSFLATITPSSRMYSYMAARSFVGINILTCLNLGWVSHDKDHFRFKVIQSHNKTRSYKTEEERVSVDCRRLTTRAKKTRAPPWSKHTYIVVRKRK